MTQGRRPQQPGRAPARTRQQPRPRPGESRRPTRSTQKRRPRRIRRSLRGASQLRLRIGFIVIAMVLSIFAVRLFELQGVDAASYVAKAKAEGDVTVTLPATRGSITDRNGVPLAESVDGMMIVADPTLTGKHASAIAKIFANRLGLDYFDVLQRLRTPGTHFQYIARRVPSAQARAVVDAIDARGYPGIDTARDPLRDYPAKDVAANLVGFMNDAGDAGEGAELSFNSMLTGKAGKASYEEGGGNRIPRSPTTRRTTRTTRASHRRPTSAPGRSGTSTSPARSRRSSPPRPCSTRTRSPRARRSWYRRSCTPTTTRSTTTTRTAPCT